MKNERKIKIGLVIMALALIVALAGCVTSRQVAQPDGTTKAEYAPDPGAVTAGQTATGIGAVVPPPYGWIISLGGALLVSVSQSVANYKNKAAARENATKAEQMEDLATTMIQGVESAGAAAKAVKEAIEARARSDGNQQALDTLVQKELS